MSQLNEELQLLRPKEVCSLLKISIPTLYRWAANDKLPFPKIKIGPGAVGFRKVDVEGFIADQINSEKQEQEEGA